ncbi:MAG: hypothetical protein ABSB78_05375 [Bacteroidota bacterium]
MNDETHTLKWTNIKNDYGWQTVAGFDVNIDGKDYSYPKNKCGGQNVITFKLNGKSYEYYECCVNLNYPHGRYTEAFDYTPENYEIWGSLTSNADAQGVKNTINIVFLNTHIDTKWSLMIMYYDENGNIIYFDSTVDISILKNRDDIGGQMSSSIPGPLLSLDKKTTLSDLYFFVERVESSPTPPSIQFLTHNTGNLEVTMFENGNIGHLYNGDIGRGVRFKGNTDALYSSGLIMGTMSRKSVNGHLGSFMINNDLVNTVHISGFKSNSSWSQIAEATFNDGGAPNPYSLTVNQISYSNTGENSMVIRYRLYGNYSVINDLFVGIFADWDVGGSSASGLNLGGYDQSRNMAYEYPGGGGGDPNYYGIIALNGMSGARVTGEEQGNGIRDSSFAWISTFINKPITVPGEYRMWIGSGPFTLSVGDTVDVYFAIVAGTTLSDLQINADAACQKYNSLFKKNSQMIYRKHN